MKNLFIAGFLLFYIGLQAQNKSVHFYELDRITVEKMFPFWYSLDIYKNKCSLDSIDLIHRQTFAMDSISNLIVDSLAKYYEAHGNIELHNNVKNSWIMWKKLKSNLSDLYFNNFIIGTGRGYFESAYERDLSKQFLITIVPIIVSLPE